MVQSHHPSRPLLVTIDGPAGAGKTTVSKMLAEKLNYNYVDTGALYRGVALAARRAGIGSDDDAALSELSRHLELAFVRTGDGQRLMLGSEDISDLIRTPEMSMLASAVSARPAVRAFLLVIQRNLGARKSAVFEGRDMGTIVFPDADLKFFLEADLRERVRRRYEELLRKGDTNVALAAVEKDMAERDRNDSTRDLAPLKPAHDAVRIDSSRLDVEEVVQILLRHVMRR